MSNPVHQQHAVRFGGMTDMVALNIKPTTTIDAKEDISIMLSSDQPDVDIIVDISRRMTTILNLGLGLPELLTEIGESTCARFDLQGVAIYLYETAHELLKLEAVFVPEGRKVTLNTPAQYRLADESPIACAARTGT